MVKDSRTLFEKFRVLSRKIFDHAARAESMDDFLGGTVKLLLEPSGCGEAGLWLKDGDKIYFLEASPDSAEPLRLGAAPRSRTGSGSAPVSGRKPDPLSRLCHDILEGRVNRSAAGFTRHGSFWTGDAAADPLLDPPAGKKGGKASRRGRHSSIAIIPLAPGRKNTGIIILKSQKAGFFTKEDMEFYETAAQTIGFAWGDRETQTALKERVKELSCLYEISQLSGQERASLDVILQAIAERLPRAWQRPEIAAGRIIFDGQAYQTPGFEDGGPKLSAEIAVYGHQRGAVEIVYSRDHSGAGPGPFLAEERNLINTVAAQIALIIQRKLAEEERGRLSEQLRHADRLATIGQLAAGVAHELNEPLGSILGFAQFVKNSPGLSEQAGRDIEKIIKSSLHAREIIKKLMLFGRQAPLQKTRVNLNHQVEEGLYFLESRCAKEGIRLTRILAPGLPEITADPSQLTQVLVNLVVNAIQAMPRGGDLAIRTAKGPDHVCLIVEDTGPGMTEEQKERIFTPFYTTKEIGQGTGLGLPVVYGIISSHGGTIRVESEPGQGARFEIRLPRNQAAKRKKGGP